MVDDIIFHSNFFFFELPEFSFGPLLKIEAQTEWFVLRLPVPERISIS